MKNSSREYGMLFEKFLCSSISAEEFQATYLDRFKNEGKLDSPLFDLLDEIFGDVDSFTTDQQLLAEAPEFYLDEAALKNRARGALLRLSAMSTFAR